MRRTGEGSGILPIEAHSKKTRSRVVGRDELMQARTPNPHHPPIHASKKATHTMRPNAPRRPHRTLTRPPRHLLAPRRPKQLLEERAAEAAGLDGSGDPREAAEPRRVVVGFVGYPNVGKSSTLNALIGEKKSSVGPQPGKTKHFQTFNMSETLMYADCPGLVFPSYADTKADMVVAGVIPIDKCASPRLASPTALALS